MEFEIKKENEREIEMEKNNKLSFTKAMRIYKRMCSTVSCENCPINKPIINGEEYQYGCGYVMKDYPVEVGKMLLQWDAENPPVYTRQEKFLRMNPNARTKNGVLEIDPCLLDASLGNDSCNDCLYYTGTKGECRKEYWLESIDSYEFYN